MQTHINIKMNIVSDGITIANIVKASVLHVIEVFGENTKKTYHEGREETWQQSEPQFLGRCLRVFML
jgi:hypothetical protein